MLDDRDLDRAKWTIVLGAIGVFVCWEVFKHLFLMDIPMLTYHLVSGIVEAVAAIGVAALGTHLLGLVAAARERQRTLSEVIGQAVGSSVTLEAAVGDIRAVAEELESDPTPGPGRVRDCARRVVQRTREIDLALHVLAQLSPITADEVVASADQRRASELPSRHDTVE